MRLTIEIDLSSQPIAGWLQLVGQPKREFLGMLELISLLEELREQALHTPPPAQLHDAR